MPEPSTTARLARLREAGVPEPGWHLRKLEAHAHETGFDLDAMIGRVLSGEPVHRVTGRREFHGLQLSLGPDTLEPRDDTEALVELVLDHLPSHLHGGGRIADLGTGTGAVALAILADRPHVHALASDVSEAALDVARANAEANGLGKRMQYRTGSWCEPLDGRFDAIVSNPPYIASHVVDGLDPSVRDHDPRLALDGGADGLDAYRTILSGAARHLAEQGFLALEIGYDQREQVGRLAAEHGWSPLAKKRDLGGHVRALAFRPDVTDASR